MITTATKPPNEEASDQPTPPVAEKGGWTWTRGLMLAAGIAVVFAILQGIYSRMQEQKALSSAAQESAIPTVKVVYPTLGSRAGEISLPGNTMPFTDTPIYARTSGYLKSWYADIGAHVKEGQLLALIETPELDQQLQQAQATLKQSQTELWLAQSNYNRYADLLKQKVISQEDFDERTSDFKTKQAAVDANAADVRRLEQLQSFEKIYAPFDGVITARNTDIGNLIQSGENTLTNQLFHLAAIDKLRVYVSVPEVDAAMIKSGDTVTLTLDSLPGKRFAGTIVRNSDSIDAVTRTLNVEVDVDNPTGQLLPGAYAFVHLNIPPTEGAVTIPSNTLLFRSEGLRVGVVRDGLVKLVPIMIGHDYGSSVEVVSGLTPADAVIVDPSDSLADGQSVQIEKAEVNASLR